MSQKNNKEILSIETLNLILLSAVALVEGIYFLIALCYVFHFFPATSPYQGLVLNEWKEHLRPERELFYYRSFVLFIIAVGAILLTAFRKRLSSAELSSSFKKYLIIKTACLAMILFSLFKIAVYGVLPYFTYTVFAAFGTAVLVKIFWFKINGFLPIISTFLEKEKPKMILSRIFDIFVPVFIFAILFVPDRHSVFARLFIEDLLYHYDGIIMASGWAFLKGCKFFVDVISQYGMGMPIFLATLTKILGGFSYEHVITVLVYLTLIYLMMCYIFLRVWLKNVLVSFIGLMLIIKFQMFHYGVSNPYIWKHPNNLVMRFFFDIPFLFILHLHIQTALRRYVFLMCAIVALALFHITDTGLYLLVTFYAYLLWLLIIPEYRKLIYRKKMDLLLIFLYFILPVVGLLTLYWVHAGAAVFSKLFWNNVMEVARFFTSGMFVLPMTSLLEEKYFQGFFAGFIVPLIYIFNLTFTGSLVLAKKAEKEDILPVVLSVYGLCMYHYYVGRSSHTYFYVVIIPQIFILCFWLNRLVKNLSVAKRQTILALISFFTLFMLFMTQSFIEYPNALALKTISYAHEREVLAKEYDFAKDASLIDRLTVSDEKVALVSSFETAILIAADRKPFFYYFPFVESRYRNMKDFGGTYLFTQERLQRALDQLEREHPRYIFIERKLLGGLPGVYYTHHIGLTVLVTYLREKYVPGEIGDYLVVMKRK